MSAGRSTTANGPPLRDAFADARQVDPDDVENDLRCLDRSRREEFVWERRAADKVGPLIRWAERVIAQSPELRRLTPAERLDHFRRVLPDDLIGRHAVSHLEFVIVGPRYAWYRPHDREHRQSGSCDVALAVDRILAAGAVGALNGALKRYFNRRYEHGDPRRVLLHGARHRNQFIAALDPDARHVVIESSRNCP